MNIEIKGVTEWLAINKLSLNIDKTHFMLFKTRNKSIELKGDLIINGVKISRVEKTKFLGVYIDSSLLWRDHIHYIEGKVARSIGAIIKARKVFNQDTLRTLYYMFLYPYFNYCIEVWGNTYSTYMDPLIKLQNRALRIITGSSRRVHLAPLYRKLNLLELPNIYMYAVQLFMYKRHHDKLPCIFRGLFCVNYEVSQRITRQSELLRMPDGKTSARRRTIVFSGVSLHNYFSHLISLHLILLHTNESYKSISTQATICRMFPNDEGIISLVFFFFFVCLFVSLVFSCSIFLSHLHYSTPLYSLPSIICYFRLWHHRKIYDFQNLNNWGTNKQWFLHPSLSYMWGPYLLNWVSSCMYVWQ